MPFLSNADSPSQAEVVLESQGSIDASIVINDIIYYQVKSNDEISQYRSNLPFQLNNNKVVIKGLVNGDSELSLILDSEIISTRKVSGQFDEIFTYTATPGYELVNVIPRFPEDSVVSKHQDIIEIIMARINNESCSLRFLSMAKALREPSKAIGDYSKRHFKKVAWFSPSTVAECHSIEGIDNIRLGILFDISANSPSDLLSLDEDDSIYGLGIVQFGDDNPIVFYQLSLRQLWSAL